MGDKFHLPSSLYIISADMSLLFEALWTLVANLWGHCLTNSRVWLQLSLIAFHSGTRHARMELTQCPSDATKLVALPIKKIQFESTISRHYQPLKVGGERPLDLKQIATVLSQARRNEQCQHLTAGERDWPLGVLWARRPSVATYLWRSKMVAGGELSMQKICMPVPLLHCFMVIQNGKN